MLTARETKDALIQRLLDSPLAAELERSLHDGTEAARRHIANALEELERKHEERQAPLAAKALELRQKRDALQAEYEEAKLAAMEAGDKATNEQHAFAARRAALQRLAKTGTEHLMELGLDSVEAAKRYVAGL